MLSSRAATVARVDSGDGLRAFGDLKSPRDKLLSPAERSREALIVRQIVFHRKNSVRTLNMELRFEGFLGK